MGLKERIASGEYQVDPTAVADAIVSRLSDAALARGCRTQAAGLRLQKECSYPETSVSAPRKTTSAAPSRTAPTRVRPERFRRWVIFPGSAYAGAGTHAHNS
jgi:Anti-sigma-28 factor, FlgM